MAAARAAARGGRRGGLPLRAVKNPIVIGGASEKTPDQMGKRSAEEMDRYKVQFAAEDAEEWQAGRVLAVERSAAGALLSVEVEASRELVPVRNSYRQPGQRAQLRLCSSDEAVALPVASAPPSLRSQRGQLWRLKGDLYAGQTKVLAAAESVKVCVDCLHSDPEVEIEPGAEVQVGPFTDEGLDLRPVLGLFQAPALLVFCDGKPASLCALRAALESENCSAELRLRDRSCAMLFCGPAPALPDSLAAWLAAVQERHHLAAALLDADPTGAESWQEAAVPAIRRLAELGEGAGALVLGSAGFAQEMASRLQAEGIKLIATSGQVHKLARVVDPEQI